MTAEVAKKSVEVGRKHILDQQLRIERQRVLLAKLERDEHPDGVARARGVVAKMEQALAGARGIQWPRRTSPGSRAVPKAYRVSCAGENLRR